MDTTTVLCIDDRPQVLELRKAVSNREFPIFKTHSEAMDWLVKD